MCLLLGAPANSQIRYFKPATLKTANQNHQSLPIFAMDAFDNIEDSIRRHEEQLDANTLKQRIQDLTPDPSFMTASMSDTVMSETTIPDVIRSAKMTTVGKFCLIVLVTFLLVQLASALGAFAVMVGASILLAVRFLFWVAIVAGLAWIIYQLIKNP